MEKNVNFFANKPTRKPNTDNELGIDFDELKEKFDLNLNKGAIQRPRSQNKENKNDQGGDCIEVLSQDENVVT